MNTKTVVHIGRFDEDGTPICLCSQQEKNTPHGAPRDVVEKDAYFKPNIDSCPSITCKACIRTIKSWGWGRKTPLAHMTLITRLLHNKVADMRGYSSAPISNSTSNSNYKKEPEPFPRVLPSGKVYLNALALIPVGDSPVVHAASYAFDGKLSPIPTCMKDMDVFEVDAAPWVHLPYEAHPSITCPNCANIMRKRRLEEEPKRDKSLAMRKAMIAAEEARLVEWASNYKWLLDAREAEALDDDIEGVILGPEANRLLDAYDQAECNLRNMKQGIIHVRD